jgi:hypothetical protein
VFRAEKSGVVTLGFYPNSINLLVAYWYHFLSHSVRSKSKRNSEEGFHVIPPVAIFVRVQAFINFIYRVVTSSPQGPTGATMQRCQMQTREVLIYFASLEINALRPYGYGIQGSSQWVGEHH